MEGQTAPAYKDLQNMVGKATQSHTLENEALNKRNITEERSPGIDRVSVSVNIDGRWQYKTDDKGNYITKPDGTLEREYIPLSQKEIDDVTALIQGAIAFDRARGDLVVVRNIPFDRTAEFRSEDAKILARKQREKLLFYSLAGLAILLLSFIIYRIIAREIERKRRILEEKRALEQQMLRENALRQAEDQGLEVSMSVEERKRIDLQEHAINMAKEHPEDVAQLIRTWLRED